MELMTVGALIAALGKFDPQTPISLRFLPIEGGHRGPDADNVPFSIDPVEDDSDKVIFVCLTEA
jgi:hypothetical protein